MRQVSSCFNLRHTIVAIVISSPASSFSFLEVNKIKEKSLSCKIFYPENFPVIENLDDFWRYLL